MLGLYLVAQGTTIRAATREGQLVPTLREAIETADRESAALHEAESEIERLREEIADLRRQATTESNDPSDRTG